VTTRPPTMHAWVVDTPGPIDTKPLRWLDRPVPIPGRGQIRIHVRVCGVCRTDLHLAEGDLIPRRPSVIPGHEVVGIVDEVGDGCLLFGAGDRVGVPWLAHTCGVCRFCTAARENLCTAPEFTGWDVDGGYAEYTVVNEGYAYRYRQSSVAKRPPRYYVQGLSATALCVEHNCPPGVDLESTASADRPTSSPRSPWRMGLASMCLPGHKRTAHSHWSLASAVLAQLKTFHLSL
jgi:propanol-preferring alcohol dehydrogenase